MSRASRHRKSTIYGPIGSCRTNLVKALQPPAAQIAPQPGFRRDVGTTKGTSTADLAAWREGHGRSLHAAAPSRFAPRFGIIGGNTWLPIGCHLRDRHRHLAELVRPELAVAVGAVQHISAVD